MDLPRDLPRKIPREIHLYDASEEMFSDASEEMFSDASEEMFSDFFSSSAIFSGYSSCSRYDEMIFPVFFLFDGPCYSMVFI